ncbi:unnamed protein product [Spodoptera exigua]|nr:unnamed protein product [Spodoptera exigua]
MWSANEQTDYLMRRHGGRPEALLDHDGAISKPSTKVAFCELYVLFFNVSHIISPSAVKEDIEVVVRLHFDKRWVSSIAPNRTVGYGNKKKVSIMN